MLAATCLNQYSEKVDTFIICSSGGWEMLFSLLSNLRQPTENIPLVKICTATIFRHQKPPSLHLHLHPWENGHAYT